MADQRLVKAIMSGKGYGMVLKGADLSGANLQGVNLERAILRNVDFTDTDLYGARLAEADFTGSDLRGADLSGADAFGAKFTGVKYDDSTKWPRGFTPPGGGDRMASRNRRASADPELVDMILRGEGKGANLTDVDLEGANLRRVNLQGAKLEGAALAEADLEGADLRGANLKDAFMNDANLFDADLGGANLTGANLRSANFTGANLASAFLKGADLRNAKLMDADFTDAILGGANLTGANLRGANFQLAILEGAILQGLDLQGLDLRDAYLVRADLRDAYLRGADLRGANLKGADLADADLTGVEYDAKTVWPQGFTPPVEGRMASRGGRKASTMAPIKFASTHPFDIAEQSAETEEILSWNMLTDGITRRAKLFSRLALDTIMPQDEIVTDFTIFGVTYRNRPVYVNFGSREVLEKCRRLFYREEDEFPEYGKCKISMSVRILPYGKDVREISEDDFNGNELGLRMNCYFQAIVKIEDLSSTREVYEDFFELEESSYILLPISAEEVEFPVNRSASRRLSRFEKGVPADPTENMSPEDAAEWEEMTEKYKDKFKKASGGTRYAAGKIVAREPYMRALQRMQDAFDRSGGDPVKLYDAIDRRVRATRELGKLQGIYDAIVFDVMRGTFGPVPRFLDVRYKALLEQLQKVLYMSRSAQY